MDLERLAVRLRPRSDWESLDLGILLVRHWWRPVFRSWLTVAFPAALLLILSFGFWGYLLFWWCLPLFEAVALHTLSRAVFGTVPPWAETLRATPELWRRARRELLLRRLHTARSLRLPVGQLEGLKGGAWRQRVKALETQGQDAPGMMTMSFLAFEIGLVIAFFSFFVLLIPSWVGIDWELFFERFFEGALPPLVYKAWWLLVAGVVILLHPFYVGAGFGVYLNRRTRLEGWDLEIAFKRLSQRLSQRMTQGPAQQSDQRLATPQTESSPGRSPSRTGAVLGVFFLVLLGGPMLAEGASVPDEESVAVEEVEETARAEAPWDGDPEDDPRRLMAEVMELPELAQRENVERWRFRWNLFDWLEGAEDTSSERNLFMEVLALLVGILIRFSEPLMWLGALCLLFILLRTAWRYLPDPDHLGRESQPVPELLFGLDLRPESLPNDIPETAQELWRKGQTTAALSLLYRGALARLGAEGVVLRESFTEDDCVRSARKEVTGERADFFAELTRTWQQVAYAHRLPEVETVGRLWNCWGEHFGGEDLGAIQ